MAITADAVYAEEYGRAFDRMFWAFLFFLDFRIDFDGLHVDLLPDFVGWIMMASALSLIDDLSLSVQRLRAIASWLIFLSLLDLIEIRPSVGTDSSVDVLLNPALFIGIALAIIDAFFVWKLCGLIIELASFAGDSVVEAKADLRRKLYLGLVILGKALIFILLADPSLALGAIVLVLPLSIVTFCLLMGLMRSTAIMCRGGDATS